MPNMEMLKTRLLIISCSARKKHIDQLTTAWDLYDGVYYRVIKKAQREGRCSMNIDFLIISAKYGIIFPSDLISNYDMKMTRKGAIKQSSTNIINLKQLFTSKSYNEVLVCASKCYFCAIEPIKFWLPDNTRIEVMPGGIGIKLQKLKLWLEK